jgi:hypothetical protein
MNLLILLGVLEAQNSVITGIRLSTEILAHDVKLQTSLFHMNKPFRKFLKNLENFTA